VGGGTGKERGDWGEQKGRLGGEEDSLEPGKPHLKKKKKKKKKKLFETTWERRKRGGPREERALGIRKKRYQTQRGRFH